VKTVIVYVDHTPGFGLAAELALQLLRTGSPGIRIVPIEHKFPIIPASRLLEQQLIPGQDELVNAVLEALPHE
jgi:hypothetical protein